MINLNDAVYVMVTTEFDARLATDEPPSFSIAPDGASPDIVDMLAEAGVRAAQRQDKYQRIKHVALMSHSEGVVNHYLLDGTQSTKSAKAVGDSLGTLRVYPNEIELVTELWANELSVYWLSVLIGYQVRSTLAFLVNRAMRYDVPMPRGLMHDLTRQYSTVDRLLDLRYIYLQGESPAVRRVPDLRDVLDYWDVLPCPIEYLATEPDIIRSPVEAWEETNLPDRVGAYLVGMRNALEKYYGECTLMSGMPGAAEISARGPKA